MPPTSRLSQLCPVRAFALLLIALLSTAFAPSITADQPPVDDDQHFETHIRPLLHTRCVRCHGENQQKGGLRLDTREAILKGGDSGPAAVPGQAANSLLMEAVRYESWEMPPDGQLKDHRIEHLELWIASGMPWPTHNGKSVRLSGAAFSEEEKTFWSLQPVTQYTPPQTDSDWVRNPIDQFVLRRLTAAGLEPAPRADNRVLLRRLHFALTGLPPAPASLKKAEQLDIRATVDRLLDDPRYGEHWARHWLDIVRYAESDGFRADGYRPHAWRYRDYVVRAFNDDKPYDVFVTEQLAGDEVAPDRRDALIATGFLRTFLYEYNQRDARTQWQDILNQVTDITGDAFLGMSVSCARCHDHKFDPILQEDYYRLRASFGTMLPRDDVPAADLAERQRYERQLQQWQQKAGLLHEQLEQLKGPYLKKQAQAAIERFPADVQHIMAKANGERGPLEQQLADLVQRQVLFEQDRAKYSPADKAEIERLEREIELLAGRPPAPLPPALTVADVSAQPFALHIGQNASRKAVTAGGFSILQPDVFALQPRGTSSGQRTALAKWITSVDNPLTARVIVNRVWQQHFGTGLVNTASDFGHLGGRPTHPELLDWLACEFMAHNWSIKWLQRIILNSATWQMSAFHHREHTVEHSDPGNALRWRFDIRRLSAEQIRDAMLVCSGELRSEIGGPSVAHDSLRRSLYLKMLRNKPEPLLSSLDGVDGLNSVPQRATTTTPTQALNLMNGAWVRARANAMAQRLLEETNSQDNVILASAAFQLALGRGPDSDELAAATRLMADSESAWEKRLHERPFAQFTEHTGTALRIGEHGVAPPATEELKPAAPFTFAAIFQLDSLYPSASVRTLVSAWDNSKSSHGWSIGVTSEKSAYQPRNLILQPIGTGGYEVVASNLRPELKTPWLVAVTVDQQKNGGQATFYLQPLSENARLQTAVVPFQSAEQLNGKLPVKLGGRWKSDGHNWDGLVDQAVFFDRCLKQQDVERLFAARLSADSIPAFDPLAFWSFDDRRQPGRSVPSDHPLTIATSVGGSAQQSGLSELCHVLLNCNEFVYID
ncbi:MAG: DUF1553 domain-containing protein [Planctomycetaceae bacterium]|nr:DUF1553 domain-containing protein [Planctomycetaceae bacterium]